MLKVINSSLGSATAFCSYPFKRFKVTCEGDVTMCCFQIDTGLWIGNILRQSFEDVWFGKIANEIREHVIQGKFHDVCNTSACPYYYRKLNFEKVQLSYPTEFEIDLPKQHCNIGGLNPNPSNPACIMCERHTQFSAQEDKLSEVCRVLKPSIKHAETLHIQGIAEPFWKDYIFEVSNWLNLEQHDLLISSTTNGTLLNKERRNRYLQFKSSWLNWSLDAATPKTYVKIRRVDMYDQIIENLLSYSSERNPEHQFVRIQNNINLLNIDEVEDMVKLAAKLKVDVLDFAPTDHVPTICVDEYNYKLFRNAQLKIIEMAKKLEVKTTFTKNLTKDYDKTINWGELTGYCQDTRLVQIK